MKYMILTYASQQDYDAMTGKPGGQAVWSPSLGHWVTAAVSASWVACSPRRSTPGACR